MRRLSAFEKCRHVQKLHLFTSLPSISPPLFGKLKALISLCETVERQGLIHLFWREGDSIFECENLNGPLNFRAALLDLCDHLDSGQ